MQVAEMMDPNEVETLAQEAGRLVTIDESFRLLQFSGFAGS
jgi:hypothetical protein